jgi:hypothetical protein
MAFNKVATDLRQRVDIRQKKLHFAIAGLHIAGLVEYQREERLVYLLSFVCKVCVAFRPIFDRRNGQVCEGFVMREVANLIVKAQSGGLRFTLTL